MLTPPTIMPGSLAQFFYRVTHRQMEGDPFRHTLMLIATGLEKTDAVLVPWLYAISKRLPSVPRRMVFIQSNGANAKRAHDLAQPAGLHVGF